MKEGRALWLSRRALTLHAVILVIVPTFAALCIWQVHRALGGNNLSWAYVFEWPFFAGYAIYMWWRFVHESPPAETAKTSGVVNGTADRLSQTDPASAGTESADPDAADLAAYNRYLAELASRDQPKRW